MAAQLSDEQVKLLREKHLALFVTLMKDGSPQVSPVWVDTDGYHILINMQEGRVKTINVKRDPRVALSVVDAANPYTRVLNVRGTVVDISYEGAADHIDFLSEKYDGITPYQGHELDRPRLLVKVRPDSIYR